MNPFRRAWLLVTLLTASCGSDGGTAPAAVEIRFLPPTASAAPGTRIAVGVALTGADAADRVVVSWTSRAPTLVRVDSTSRDGKTAYLSTGLVAGSSYLIVDLSGALAKRDSMEVRVIPPAVRARLAR